ncbi:MAG: helix-turn-helix transcriptional regulator [Candidatus Omnitrophica bacterium]|nr:helix-turn-helix transcriptional regulator [Candidatus Omnitrophota bacterium]
MRKSIFDKEMENSKFKAVYDEASANMSIGEQIAELRHKAKMSQLELAQKVKTSRTAIVRYESGNYKNFNVGTLTRIARAFRKNLKISFSS